jgi:uncharacterized ion transporter superfamily protein YfcC
MKWTKHDSYFALIIAICTIVLLWIIATGCTSTKNVQKSFTDSSTTKDDSIRLLKAERDLFEQHYNELLYAEVLFDTLTLHDTIHNTVFITKGGEIRAEGNIKKASVNKNVYLSIIAERDRIIDSFKSVKDKVRVVTETKQVEKKTTVFPWWFIIIMGGIFIIVKKLKFI